MKKSLIVIGATLLALSVNTAYARCVGSVVNGKCYGVDVHDSDSGGYKGSSGSSYQYDMSNPSDKNRYSIDLDAQRRDQMNLGSGKSLDKGLGQYGGGIND